MSKRKVIPAQYRYAFGCLGSFDRTSHMYIRQFQFPDEYDSSSDKMISADSDRCFQWDYEHARKCFTEHTGTGEMGIVEWAKNASDEQVLSFIADILKADPGIKWTGYRILGSVHQSNGYPVWSLSLFSKGDSSDTIVYSDENAPNVIQKYPTESYVW